MDRREEAAEDSSIAEVGVHAPALLVAGSRAEIRVLLQSARDQGEVRPLAGVRVTAVLESRGIGRARLGEAVSGPDGAALLTLAVPEVPPGGHWISLRADTPQGPAELRREVRIRSDARLLLAADPRFPVTGGATGIRVRLLRALSPAPIADAAIELAVTDPGGNVLLHRRLVSDPYGAARVSLPIAAGARTGAYVVTASWRDLTRRCALLVARDRPAPPGSSADDALHVTVFPAGGGLVPDLARALHLHLHDGCGRPLAGRVVIAVAGARELPDLPLGPAEGLDFGPDGWAEIEACVPAGYMVPAHPGVIEPEAAACAFQDARLSRLAAVVLRWTVRAGDREATGESRMDAWPADGPIAVEPDAFLVEAGGTLAVELRSSPNGGPVFLDLLHAGQVVQSTTVAAPGPVRRVELAVPAGACGPIEIRAWRTLPQGRVAEDARAVLVVPRSVLRLSLEPVADGKAPGEACGPRPEGTLGSADADDSRSAPGPNGGAGPAPSPRVEVALRVRDAEDLPALAGVELFLAPAAGAAGVLEPWIERCLELRGHDPLVSSVLFPGFLPTLRALALGERPDPVALRAYLSLLPPLGPYGWSVEPSAERRQRAIHQIRRSYEGLAAFAERRPFAQRDPATGAFGFLPDLLDRVLQEGRLLRADLTDLSGRPYTLGDLAALDPRFGFEALARAVTGVRIRRVYEALAEFGRRHERWWARGPWEFPDEVAALLDAEKLIEPAYLEDAWGSPLQILRSAAPFENPRLPRGLESVRVVSGGPDGVFGPGDPDEPLFSVHEAGRAAPPPEAAIPPVRVARRAPWPHSPLRRALEAAGSAPPSSAAVDDVIPVRSLEVSGEAAVSLHPPPGGPWTLVAVAMDASGHVTAARLPIAPGPTPAVEPTPAGPPVCRTDLCFGLALRPGRSLTAALPEGCAPPRVRRIAGPLNLALEAWHAVTAQAAGDLDDALAVATASALLIAALQAHRRSWPEPAARAEESAICAYQEILARECDSGGFPVHGAAHGHPVVTARTLLALHDLGRATEVDRRAIERIAGWMEGAQDRDGAWPLDRTAGGWDALTTRFAPTAYVLGALAGCGLHGPAADRAAAFLRKHLKDAQADPYALALALGALLGHVPGDATLAAECDRLATLARLREGAEPEAPDEVSWAPAGATLFATWGDEACSEATALAVLALRQAPGPQPRAVAGAFHLLRTRGPDGGWGPHHATETALRALLRGDHWTAPLPELPRLALNGVEREFPPADDAIPGIAEIEWPAGGAILQAHVASGEGFPVQVVLRRLVPWDACASLNDRARCALVLSAKASTTSPATGETFDLEIAVENAGSFPVWRSAVSLEAPPSLRAEAGPKVRLDLGVIKPREQRTLRIPLTALAPGPVRIPPIQAWEVHGSGVRAWAGPIDLTVTEGQAVAG